METVTLADGVVAFPDGYNRLPDPSLRSSDYCNFRIFTYRGKKYGSCLAPKDVCFQLEQFLGIEFIAGHRAVHRLSGLLCGYILTEDLVAYCMPAYRNVNADYHYYCWRELVWSAIPEAPVCYVCNKRTAGCCDMFDLFDEIKEEYSLGSPFPTQEALESYTLSYSDLRKSAVCSKACLRAVPQLFLARYNRRTQLLLLRRREMKRCRTLKTLMKATRKSFKSQNSLDAWGSLKQEFKQAATSQL